MVQISMCRTGKGRHHFTERWIVMTKRTKSRMISSVISFLVKSGADVHALDNNHSTPLHFISQYGGDGAARVLLEHGAVIDARDNNDSTPLHVASRCGNAEVSRLLLEHGANIHTQNKVKHHDTCYWLCGVAKIRMMML